MFDLDMSKFTLKPDVVLGDLERGVGGQLPQGPDNIDLSVHHYVPIIHGVSCKSVHGLPKTLDREVVWPVLVIWHLAQPKTS